MDPWTFEKAVDAGGLPRFLRDLADALEHGAAGGFAGLPPLRGAGRVQRLELAAQAREDGGYAVRLTAGQAGRPRAQGRNPVPAGSQPTARAPGKTASPRPGEAQARAREKYRQLKKALQADFSALSRAVEAGTAPQRDTLESFLALAEGMAALPQPVRDAHGPEASELARANAAFLEDAQSLRRAYDARDMSAFAQALARLERRRGACHAQYR